MMTLEGVFGPEGSQEKVWFDDDNRFEVWFDASGRVVASHRRFQFSREPMTVREAWRQLRWGIRSFFRG